ncbi:MAG: alkaline phosphatase family protein [Terriglobales bacterium]
MSKKVAFLSSALLVLSLVSFSFAAENPVPIAAKTQGASPAKPRVLVIGVNGMELDLVRPLILQGKMPNLASVAERGVYGKLRTLSAPNCPKVYTTIFTSTPPEQNGITGFLVGGITANTNMLKAEPFWSVLSKKGVTVGMANVPGTFPVMPVNGYMISGMLTRGKNCEDGVLCSPKLTEVEGGDPVYPKSMVPELLQNVGNFNIDCSRMPSAEQLERQETKVINEWLAEVDSIRAQQTKLFEYLLTKHPTDFTMLVQSCEDRVGHWLYPIQPFNAGYNPKINSVRVDAFPNQYVAFDALLGKILKHVDDNTYLFIVSDHGIKPLREFEEKDPHAHSDHQKTTPVIAKHDFADGDDVPGSFFAMGPNIRRDYRLLGFPVSVYDIAPTLLHLYGIPQPAQMKGRVLTELFDNTRSVAEKSKPEERHMH